MMVRYPRQQPSPNHLLESTPKPEGGGLRRVDMLVNKNFQFAGTSVPQSENSTQMALTMRVRLLVRGRFGKGSLILCVELLVGRGLGLLSGRGLRVLCCRFLS